jgi:hypothetical protein
MLKIKESNSIGVTAHGEECESDRDSLQNWSEGAGESESSGWE